MNPHYLAYKFERINISTTFSFSFLNEGYLPVKYAHFFFKSPSHCYFFFLKFTLQPFRDQSQIQQNKNK